MINVLSIINILAVFPFQIFPKRRKIGLTRPSSSGASSSASASGEVDYKSRENVIDDGADDVVMEKTRETRCEGWLEYGIGLRAKKKKKSRGFWSFLVLILLPETLQQANQTNINPRTHV